MISKSVLIGSFVPKNKILSFIENIKNTFNIRFEKIFVYSIESNDKEYLVSFKVKDRKDVTDIENSTILHVKNSCLFSINALNKLINSIKGDDAIDNKDFKIDWNEYKDKLIIVCSNELKIHKINKLENKCMFFS